jgi:hypothetical protein
VENQELAVRSEVPQNVMMFSQDAVSTAVKWCTHIAASSLVPEHFKGKIDNTFLAFYKAQRLNMDPIALMEMSYVVHGKLGYEAKLITSLINNSGLFTGLLKYKFTGELKRGKDGKVLPESTRECTAYTTEKATGEKLEMSCNISMAFAEGWTNDKGSTTSKWHTMTENMLMYRAASFFGKMYCPQLIAGMNTREELEDSPQDAEFTDVDADHAKELFTVGLTKKGEQELADVHPVHDPSLEVKAAVQGQGQTSLDQPTPKPEYNDENPPPMPEFAKWFFKRFEKEAGKIDAVLIDRKWLDPGESAPDLTMPQLTKLRDQWGRLYKSFTEWKQA